MRRPLVPVAAAISAAVVLALAFAVPMWPSPVAADGPATITRLFIPAIKVECRMEAGISDEDARFIGYTFTSEGALVTIDRTGVLTGIASQTLEEFNACLSEYPIQPLPQVPRNHYSRNLQYDYISGILQPCLADRVDGGLPSLPTRSDFVERLYVWDPYRVIAPRMNLQQLIELTVQCPEVPPYLTSD